MIKTDAKMNDQSAAGKGEKAMVGGLKKARLRSHEVDRLIKELHQAAKGDSLACSLVAIGGYGRGELSPSSDLDLLILYEGRKTVKIDEFAGRIFYPLWDAGFQLGHGVQNLRSGLRAAKTDFDLLTASLDCRLLAGKQELFEAFKTGILRIAGQRRGQPFIDTLIRKSEERYLKFGDSAYMLEPHIKNGAGGLRDYQSILWAGKVLRGSDTLSELENAGYLEHSDIRSLNDAADFMFAVREHLHALSGRAFDLLTFDYQESIAEAMGYEGDQSFWPVERFMQDYYLHASNLEFIISLFWRQLKNGPAPGKSLMGNISPEIFITPDKNYLRLRDDFENQDEPGYFMHLLETSTSTGIDISADSIRRAIDLARRHPDKIIWSKATLGSFISLLESGPRVKDALEILMMIGWLNRLIPEMAAKRCRPLHGSYHRYTIDAHSFHTVAELCRLLSDSPAETDPSNSLIKEIEDRRALFLAALLHDIGKGAGADHALAGARIAASILMRMGVAEPMRRQVALLIKYHLLLAKMATRRDIDDEDLIIEIAGKIQDSNMLKMLYALTVADGVATSPEAWTFWKSVLVRELFWKTLHVLDSGEAKKDNLDLAKKRRDDVRAILQDKAAIAAADGFIASMPRAYVLRQESQAMASHFMLLSGVPRKRVKTAARPLGNGIYEVVVAAVDRPGLFASVSGTMSLNGLDILEAQAYSSKQGFAIEIFKVRNIFDSEPAREKWLQLEAQIRLVLKGKLSLESGLDERLARYQNQRIQRRSGLKVDIDNESSDFYTIIEVHAMDRIGLLHDITKSLADNGIDIHMAKVSTAENRVIDVFYVRDMTGQKVTDHRLLDEVKANLIRKLRLDHKKN